MTKYLDNEGLTHFTGKMKEYADGKAGEVDGKVTTHIDNKENPHGVTKAQVGLGSVDNVQQIPLSQKGAVNGVATLDANGKIPVTQMPTTKTINGASIFGTGNLQLSASLYKIVDKLPTTGIDTSKIYLVPASATTAKNNKTEYIYLGDPNKAYDESKWEKLGDEQKSSTITTPGGSITVDTSLIENSPNPVAGGVVKAKIDEIDGKLAKKVESSDYTTKMTAIDSTLEDLKKKETITVDAELKDSPNPVQNRAVNAAVQNLNTEIGKKANSTDLNAATGKITTLETNAATKVIETGEGNGISGISKSGNTITAKKGNFLTSAAGLATKNDILPDTLASKGIATKTWVNDQGFATGTIPTKTSQLTNDSGFLTNTALAGYVNDVKPDGTSGNGIAGITKDGKTLKVTKSTFLTAHQSLAGYVNDVNVTEVTNGNGIASITKTKEGKILKVTQGAFLTGTSNGTIYEEETQTENGKGIVDIFLRGNMLCKRKGTFVTSATLGDAINKYASDKGYLTEDNLNEKLKETVIIKLVSDKSDSDTGLIGATITVKSGDTTVSTQTWQGTPINVKVPCDKDVTIEAATVKMYMKPKALVYVPSPLYNREVTFTYKALNTGTYIIDKNDNLYKTADLLQASGVARDDTLGVLLVTDSIAIVIARTVISEKAWSTGTGLVEGCTTTTDSYSGAIKDFAGAANTAAIVKKHNALDEAAASCNRYIFKNGKKGYLMSAGEALAIQANIDTIGRLLVDISPANGNVMADSGYYWTSTQYDASKAYYVRMNNKYPSNSYKTYKYDVAPIYSIYD